MYLDYIVLYSKNIFNNTAELPYSTSFWMRCRHKIGIYSSVERSPFCVFDLWNYLVIIWQNFNFLIKFVLKMYLLSSFSLNVFILCFSFFLWLFLTLWHQGCFYCWNNNARRAEFEKALWRRRCYCLTEIIQVFKKALFFTSYVHSGTCNILTMVFSSCLDKPTMCYKVTSPAWFLKLSALIKSL